jgi:hypothetical protein
VPRSTSVTSSSGLNLTLTLGMITDYHTG